MKLHQTLDAKTGSIGARRSSVVLALDIGGTKIAAALVDEAGTIVSRFPDVPTPLGPDAIEDLVETYLARVPMELTCGHVGVSMAGFVSSDSSTVVLAPNLGLRDYRMGERLSRRLGLPATVENDVNSAAWGEYRFGAGQGAAVMILVMAGTGLGGGIVVNGALLRGEHGFAAEIGHIRHLPDGPSCACGNDGCWEQYVSSHALRRDQDRHLSVRAPEGHPSFDVYEGLGAHLGLGIADLVMLLDPSVVVLSGGISNAFSDFENVMLDSMRSRLGSMRTLPSIAVSDLGAAAALRGVADICVGVGALR